MTTVDLTPGAILLRAADLIERHGKAAGTYHNPEDGYCAVGALRAAAGLDPNLRPVIGGGELYGYTIARAALCRHLAHIGANVMSLTAWSDGHPEAGPVIAALRAAAAPLLPARRGSDPDPGLPPVPGPAATVRDVAEVPPADADPGGRDHPTGYALNGRDPCTPPRPDIAGGTVRACPTCGSTSHGWIPADDPDGGQP